MKKSTKYFAIAFVFSQCSFSVYSQLTTSYNSPYNSAPYLVQNVLTGAGMNTSNVTFSGDPKQFGFFNGINSNLGLDSGIVLANDDIQGVIPGGYTSGITGIGGDNDLLTIANSVPPLIGQSFSVSSTYDRSVLEFDFIPFCDTMKFEYIFGSDEYLTYINTGYNDVFAFFISGPGISGPYQSPAGFPNGAINIAFVPNSSPELPITISSVNNVLNAQYYIDNPGNNTVGLNGFTTVFTAFVAVTPGETYHMKLAIADGSDGALASAVFFNAKSFGTNGAELNYFLSSTDESCSGACNGSATVNVQDSLSFLWSNGQTNSAITSLCSGQYSVTITSDSSACPSIGYVSVNLGDSVSINTFGTNSSCFGICDGTASVSFQDSAFFLWSNGQTDSTAYGLCTGQYSVTVTSADSACVVSGTVNISSPPEIIISIFSIPDSGNHDGAAKAIISGGFPPYTFLWSDSLQQTIFNPTGLSAGVYFVTVTDSSGCTATDSVEVLLYVGEKEIRVSDFRFQVSPNPNNGKFDLQVTSPEFQNGKIEIFNTLGKEIYRVPAAFCRLSTTIDISNQPHGIFFLKIILDNGMEDFFIFVKSESFR